MSCLDSTGSNPTDLARRKLELEIDTLMIEIEKLRADLRNDQRRTNYQMVGLLVGAVAAAATLLAAGGAFVKLFLYGR